MQHAISLARQAASLGEVPVGAVIVKDNQLIAEGYNLSITENDPSAHAEMIAIRHAGKEMNNYRLNGSTLYVTLEPCMMCAGAMVHARIDRLVFAAFDPKTGVVESRGQFLDSPFLNHRVQCQGGLLLELSAEILSEFFQDRRRSQIS